MDKKKILAAIGGVTVIAIIAAVVYECMSSNKYLADASHRDEDEDGDEDYDDIFEDEE